MLAKQQNKFYNNIRNRTSTIVLSQTRINKGLICLPALISPYWNVKVFNSFIVFTISRH